MKTISEHQWHPRLADPSGRRQAKPRTSGLTMVIDKGLGMRAFEDLLETAGEHIDMVKIGFGTSPLYPLDLLRAKIELAKENDICIYPGGTFLEVAIVQGAVDEYFAMVSDLGFNGIEVSDGTISMDRSLRSRMIERGIKEGKTVVTEYGKKSWNSAVELTEFLETMERDVECGASLVIVEGRESGAGVGIYDENGQCRDEQIQLMLEHVRDRHRIMWEAPQKQQQVHLLKMLGADIHIGNVACQDVLSLEALRRGLRSDTFFLFSGRENN